LFNDKLSFLPHIESILTSVSQRFYLLGQLRRQGLDMHGLDIVFKSIILSKILYACQSFSGYLLQNDIDRLQACLNKAYRWGFTRSPISLTELMEERDNSLFQQIQQSWHCLHQLLPTERDMHGRSLRPRGHNYELPLIKFELHKLSFINKCLFKYI
jgi:hypothetical protein